MKRVEYAQIELDRAAQLLSSIRYGSDLSDKAFGLRQAVHKFWWRLNKAAASRDGMSLDSEADPVTRHRRTDDAGVIATEQTVEADGSWEPR